MPKRLTPQVILALQEALAVIYYYRDDLRKFLETCGVDRAVVGHLNWDQYKRYVVRDLFEVLLEHPDSSISVMTSLCRDVASMDNFSHLAKLKDGERKVITAKAAVEELRRLLGRHDEKEEDERLAEVRRMRLQETQVKQNVFQSKLSQIHLMFRNVAAKHGTPQTRGAELEAVMTEVFELFELDPKSSFRITGEQIDGAFSLDGTDYLFEAKWEKDPIDRATLDVFSGKIGRKLDNTLGLLLSMSGFMQTAIDKYSDRRATFLLMDGYDLQAVLEQRIDFVEMLRRKRRHAAETGNIFLQIYPTLL